MNEKNSKMAESESLIETLKSQLTDVGDQLDAKEIQFGLKSQVVDKMTAKAEDYEAKITQLNAQVEQF